MKRQVAIEIISCLFIFLFVYAAVTKLTDIEKFRVQIGQSPLLTGIAGLVSWLVPATELLIAVLLIFPKYRLVGLLSSLTIMVMFTCYIFIIMNFSEHIPCSCGGVLQRLSWRDHLIFNMAFVIAAIAGITLQFSMNSKDGRSAKDILLQ